MSKDKEAIEQAIDDARLDDILTLIKSRQKDNHNRPITTHAKRYQRLKERLHWDGLDAIITEAALIGMQYGFDWNDQPEVAKGIIQCNSMMIAERVADAMDDSIPEPSTDSAERAEAILAKLRQNRKEEDQ